MKESVSVTNQAERDNPHPARMSPRREEEFSGSSQGLARWLAENDEKRKKAGEKVMGAGTGSRKRASFLTYPLLLASGKLSTALSDVGIVSFREGLDELVGVGRDGGLFDFLLRGARKAVGDVPRYRSAEERRFLRHDAYLVAIPGDVEVLQVDPFEFDGALRDECMETTSMQRQQ